MFNGEYTKKIMDRYFLIWVVILIIIISFFVMYKYYVKGETNMPFKVSKIYIVSSAQTENIELEENKQYVADIIQKNDIYISIEKNNKYKKDEIIKQIKFDNFKIIEDSDKGSLTIYRPSKKEGKTYEYIEEYEVSNIEYIGTQKTDIKSEELTIANQGGIIQFSICLKDLGSISYSENENVQLDGMLLKNLKLKTEDISKKISFDMEIELESGVIFYTNMEITIPTGDIAEEGISNYTNENMNNLVFKRK